MIKLYFLDSNLNNDYEYFDIDPTKHAHTLDIEKNFYENKSKEVVEYTGIRFKVYLFDINYESLKAITLFIDEMEGTFTHSDNITLVIKDFNKEHNISPKIGVFSF
jgi:hypothetical protein